MESRLDLSGGLKYAGEHLICENYLTGKAAMLECVELETDSLLVREKLKRSTLVFVLSGEIIISTGRAIHLTVEADRFFLVPVGGTFYGKASSPSRLLRCSFEKDMELCNRFSLKRLEDFVPANPGESPFPVLPVRETLSAELRATCMALRQGLRCTHYQRYKKEVIFMLLRAFYTREELARFFFPVLGGEGDFKDRVMRIAPEVDNAKEMMARLNMSPTTFKQKFRESFGTSCGKWLIQNKKENLFRDLVMTESPVAELAEKYRFTANYLSAFCKEHFNATPTELRNMYSERK